MRIIDAIVVFEDGQLSGFSYWLRPPADQLELDGLEEGFDSRVVATVSLAAQQYLESNRRNCTSNKVLKGKNVELAVATPGDRNSGFEAELVKKG